MQKRDTIWVALFFLYSLVSWDAAQAQQSYHNYKALTGQLKQLASEHSDFASLTSLATTKSGKNVWLMTIGSGDVANHPAVAVVGGAKGSHILGSELTLDFAKKLLEQNSADSLRKLLGSTTFYVFPRINPDATEQYFADLKYERDANLTPTDDDRDGAISEDPYEDLNKDGWVTMVRVKDETGKWVKNPDDSRIMKKADAEEGERGSYRLLTEGIDNDKDGAFNEDGPGGVNLNKNFTFKYPYFKPGAGENMASQKENRAVMDFLYEKGWNVYAVVSFGPENNLSKPVSFNPKAVQKRVISGWYKEDAAINKMISDLYNKEASLTGAPKGPGQPGDFFQWAYFHYGRFSFSTPGWWTPPVNGQDGKPKKFDNADVHYLAWADQHNIDAFVKWQPVNHPDFPDQEVEVGGIKPFYRTTPPYSAVDSLAEMHTRFIIKLADMRPQIKLTNFKQEKVGRGLTRITVDVYNSGQFPTASKVGERTRWVRNVNIGIDFPDEIAMVSGQKLRSVDSIPADGTISMSWLLQGKGTYTIKAGAPHTGFSTIQQKIK